MIAGNRKFPLLFAEAAKSKGYCVVAIAIKADTCRQLNKYADKVYWLGLNEFSRMFEIFKKEEVKKVVMAGQISPKRLFSKEIEQDPELRVLLSNIKDKRADTIFGAIAELLQEAGLQLLSSVSFLGDYFPKKGALTKTELSPQTWEDVLFGMELAKAIAALDIGQTVAVKSKAVVAVEALEGTDNLIRRSGSLGRAGITVVKVSKPKQDERFDVPVVGLNTIKSLIKSGAKCLAIEADKVLFIDKEESIKLADKKGLSIVAV